MLSLRCSFFASALLLFAVNFASAATFAVGTCKPALPSYTSIQAAVNSVPAGSIVDVCPGTYAEQVTIPTPLTLQGISSGNSSNAVIAVPSSGLVGVPDNFGVTIFAMVAVNAGLAGPVTIKNINLDGSGYVIDCNGGLNWLIAIYFPSDSSGTVSSVAAHDLQTTSCGSGTGVWIENTDNSNVTSLTVENSSFHDIDNSSLITNGKSLTATVKGNFMGASGFDIQWDQNPGTLSGNYITSGTCCSSNFSGPATISGNTFSTSTYAVETFGGSTVLTSNKFMNVGIAIQEAGSGDSYKANVITKAKIGIEFYCNLPAVVANNTITDAATGLDEVPAGFSGANKFSGVGTVRNGGCASGPTKRDFRSRVSSRIPRVAPLE